MENVQVCIEMTRKQYDQAKDSADTDGLAFEITDAELTAPRSPLEETQFVDIVLVGLQATALSLATWLIKNWLRPRRTGVEIDLREHPPKVSRPAGIAEGWLYLIQPDGAIQRIELSEDERNTAMLRQVLVDALSAVVK